MPVLLSNHALMTFNTNLNKTRALRINNPADSIVANDIETASDHFIAADIFEPEHGVLTSLLRADIIKEYETVLIAPTP